MKPPPQPVTEIFEHDDCRYCGAHSIPAEGVPDQALRGCPESGVVWFEDFFQPPYRANTPKD